MPDEQTTIGQIGASPQIGTAEYFIASPFFAGFEDYESPEYNKFLNDFATLPPYSKVYFSSPETAVVIFSLGVKFDLDEMKISQIASLVRDVVIGNIFIKDLPSLISTKLNVDEQKGKEIANTIVVESFKTISGDIQRIQRAKFPERIAQMKATQTAQPGSRTSEPLREEFARGKQSEVSLPGKPSQQPSQITRPQTPPPPQRPVVPKPLEEELEKVASIIDLRNPKSS